jgi:hypothetical protein
MTKKNINNIYSSLSDINAYETLNVVKEQAKEKFNLIKEKSSELASTATDYAYKFVNLSNSFISNLMNENDKKDNK